MKLLIVVFLLAFSLNVNAVSLGKLAGVILTKGGTKSTIKLTKDAGTQSVTGSSKAVGQTILQTIDVPLGGSLQVVSNVPKVSLVKSVVDLAKKNWLSTAIGVGSTVLCDMYCQSIKDWLDHGALGLDKDGNLTKEDGYTGNCVIDGRNSSTTPLGSCINNLNYYHIDSTGAYVINQSIMPSGVMTAYCMSKNNGVAGQIYCYSPVPSTVPATPEEATPILQNTPLTDSEFQKVVEALHKISLDKKDPTVEAEGGDPVLSDSQFPIRKELPPTEEVTPDGKYTKTQDTIECQKIASDTCECTKITNTSVTNNDNSVVNYVTNNAPSESDLGLTKNPVDYCVQNPDYLGCLKFGVPQKAEQIPVTNQSIALSPTSLGAGYCPAPKTVALHVLGLKTLVFDNQIYCDFATKINPIVLAIAWLSAGFIVVGVLRDS